VVQFGGEKVVGGFGGAVGPVRGIVSRGVEGQMINLERLRVTVHGEFTAAHGPAGVVGQDVDARLPVLQLRGQAAHLGKVRESLRK
jgi:hypothetical protein